MEVLRLAPDGPDDDTRCWWWVVRRVDGKPFRFPEGDALTAVYADPILQPVTQAAVPLKSRAVVEAFQHIGAALESADEATREAIAALLARLARLPHEAAEIGSLVQRLLSSASTR